MSGTSINNNVVESYPQLLLLYNGSANMLCKARQLYSVNEETGEYEPYENDRYMQEYPPYIEGLSYFRHSHLPEKLTVFGVVQRRQDILNARELREIISYIPWSPEPSRRSPARIWSIAGNFGQR